MRSFTDLDALIGMVPSQVVTRLSAIDFGRGSEALYRDQMPGLLTELADRAQRIIDRRTTTLRNRSEQELAGYRDAQDNLANPEVLELPDRGEGVRTFDIGEDRSA